ncbi:hypothetical protein [Kordiimonas aquimaris]|uniref:hypothetical protein n=1 Tax=Kordiimonas aquimaris TaxID=707591 RepID=UPI0021D38752|nr:hypothetical protein [Kordiimonas aquimaris]
MNKKIKLFSALIAGFGSMLTVSILSASAINAADYYVVVNTENNFNAGEDELKAMLRRVYLKTAKNWPGGTTAIPFARKASNTAHTALLGSILMMTDTEHGAHWARLKQTTGDTPPRAVGSDSILLRLIKREPGAVGIIESKGTEPEGVKVLLKFSS